MYAYTGNNASTRNLFRIFPSPDEFRISSSYNATQLWFNHSCSEFQEFKDSLKVDTRPPLSVQTVSHISYGNAAESSKSPMIVTTIDDLYERAEEGYYWVPGRIVTVESTTNWYYHSCRSEGCFRKLHLKSGALQCLSCGTTWQEGNLRYRLIVRVGDKTTDAPFLLWDKECCEIVGKTALDLRSKYCKDGSPLPTGMEEVRNKAMVFKISAKNDHFKNKAIVIPVVAIAHDSDLVDHYCPCLSNDQDQLSRMLNEDDQDAESDESESGDEASSPNPTQAKKQKLDEQEEPLEPVSSKRNLLDQFSSSRDAKKTKTVLVKQEKKNDGTEIGTFNTPKRIAIGECSIAVELSSGRSQLTCVNATPQNKSRLTGTQCGGLSKQSFNVYNENDGTEIGTFNTPKRIAIGECSIAVELSSGRSQLTCVNATPQNKSRLTGTQCGGLSRQSFNVYNENATFNTPNVTFIDVQTTRSCVVDYNTSSPKVSMQRGLMSAFNSVVHDTPSNSTNGDDYYSDLGDQTYSCDHCGAMFWLEERVNKSSGVRNPKYSLCCSHGKIKLSHPNIPPMAIRQLFFNQDQKSTHFLKNIRSFNNMFCFTSMGGKIDRTVNNGSAPPTFRLHGQNFHLMGSLLPQSGERPKFAQLYIYDTQNEIENHLIVLGVDESTNTMHREIVKDIKDALDENNVLVKSFRMAKTEMESNHRADIKIKLIGKRSKDARTYNLPQVGEVAALIVGDLDPNMGERYILVESKAGHFQRITELNPAYFPLQYPLLFPYGEDGYRDDIQFNNVEGRSSNSRSKLNPREYFSFRLQDRFNEMSTLLYARQLFQQYLVDAYTMIESGRLVYIRCHQKSLRCESYKCLIDALTRGEVDPTSQGKRIILPSSFTGGARYMVQNYQDAMSNCRWIRKLKAEDRPDIVCRVFKMKLNALIKDIKKEKIFGLVDAVIYTIEFQKKGLPHAHILIFLSKSNSYPNPKDIDMIISAEIPSQLCDPEYYKAVEEFMIHSPCGAARKNSPCMINGICSKFFPKKFVENSTVDFDGYPIYRRRDNGRTIRKNGIDLDSRYVVPHNRHLLMKYKAHINVEWCNQSRSIKYLFKYVNKGNDRVTAEFYNSGVEESTGKIVDEIKMYYDCRNISPPEAAWRIFGFDIQFRNPSVERLSFHLPNEQSIIFHDDDLVDDVVNRPTVAQSMFTAWFEANKKYAAGRQLTYSQMPTKFVWKNDKREWQPRQRNWAIGRIFYVPPNIGEIFYLRCLLNIVRGPTSFDEIKKVDGVQYNSFRDACYARGLIEDDKDSMSKPENVWEMVWQYLSDDAEYIYRRNLSVSDLNMNESQKKNFALLEMEKLLNAWNKSLSDYPPMPMSDGNNDWFCGNRLLLEEMSYDREALMHQHNSLHPKLTDEQLLIYNKVMGDVETKKGGMYFVYGYGGTGKTFLWKTISAALRSKGEVVLNVASSGIASLLLPGGRTAHSRFAIPLGVNEDSTCNIKQGSPLAELIIKSKLIIWDEAPMMHKHCFETLDRTMRDLMRFKNSRSSTMTFGGKTVVLGGDFRQILPVILKGTRQDIIQASINSSYLWNNCEVLRLTKNLRLRGVTNEDDVEKLDSFAKWIADLGDGNLGEDNDVDCNTIMPYSIVLENEVDPIKQIVESTFPEYRSGNMDETQLENRAILAPTLDVVDEVNEYMNGINQAASRTYLSCDSVCKAEANFDMQSQVHTTEFLNSLRCSGVPNHSLTLKMGTPVMLLRNIDHSMGLCNGTRLIVTQLGNHVIEGKIIAGNNAVSRVSNPDGLKVLICGESRDLINKTQNVVYKEIFNNL
ncbi:PREDICTED: uncharacterized protein LOC109157627 [Ipomoea nil]|uniref:uncharacterized protein LOC109157627 n=1 Tax=Ipomoea nil TaxID=35883 RepID=UPI0009015154|nr:PREDICTED: uncharacterized protein LOC109157627 [Ipomoea nil]